jgi:hypothetical protein
MMGQTQAEADDDTKTFDRFQFGDKIVYTGPTDLPGDFVAPSDREQPYTFQHMTINDSLKCMTRFKGPKLFDVNHPANNPEYWEKV